MLHIWARRARRHCQQMKQLQLLIPVRCDISSRSTRLDERHWPAFFFFCPATSPRSLSHATIQFLLHSQFTCSLASRPITINSTHRLLISARSPPPPSFFFSSSSQSPATCVTQPCHFSPASPSQFPFFILLFSFSFFLPPLTRPGTFRLQCDRPVFRSPASLLFFLPFFLYHVMRTATYYCYRSRQCGITHTAHRTPPSYQRHHHTPHAKNLDK